MALLSVFEVTCRGGEDSGGSMCDGGLLVFVGGCQRAVETGGRAQQDGLDYAFVKALGGS